MQAHLFRLFWGAKRRPAILLPGFGMVVALPDKYRHQAQIGAYLSEIRFHDRYADAKQNTLAIYGASLVLERVTRLNPCEHGFRREGLLMSVNRIGTFMLAGLVVLFPVDAAVRSCGGQAPTFPSNYSQQASALLHHVRHDVQQIEDQVAELKRLANDQDVSWGEHALQLDRVLTEVDEISNWLCRLEVIQWVAENWQRRVISDLAVQLRAMGTDAQTAFAHVRQHDGGALWSPPYRKCIQRLYDEALAAANRIDSAERGILERS